MNDIPESAPLQDRFKTAQIAQATGDAAQDVLAVLKRQFWLIAACTAMGMFFAVLYWSWAELWYESEAKVLVSMRDTGLATSSEGASFNSDGVKDDILANHMEIVRSRRIVSRALETHDYADLPSLKQALAEDPETDVIDFVTKHLKLTRGGDATAKDARSLNIALELTNPEDTQLILEAIVAEYEAFLNEQIRTMTTQAVVLIEDARDDLEKQLNQLQVKLVANRKNAPILYQGVGTGNTYQERVATVQNELTTIDIEHAALTSKLGKVLDALKELDENSSAVAQINKLSLIDNASLERLSTFATLQMSAAGGAEFQANQPFRAQLAESEISILTKLMAEKLDLEAQFGPNHPALQKKIQEIELVQETTKNIAAQYELPETYEPLTPESLLSLYVDFIKSDIAALEEKKLELQAINKDTEDKAKELLEFEFEDKMLEAEIERKSLLFDGIVEQLRKLDTASGMSGFIHEVLESPRLGKETWPDLPMILAAGTILGLIGGLVLAVGNDQSDKRFRTTSEITAETGVPIVSQVGHLRRPRGKGLQRNKRLIVDSQAPEAESFRLLRTQLLQDVKSGKLRVISVTSCQSKDGKSVILSNLAASFADLGVRTLIIDGDMRAPTVHRFFNLQIDNGLSEVLRGKLDLQDAYKQTEVDGLSIISAGAAVRNPAELLQAKVFDDVIAECQNEFDLILIDSGPVLMVSDPAIISQKANATFLVIRTAANRRRQATEAVNRLRAAQAKLQGIIVNTYGSGKEFTKDTSYSSGYYYYGYGYGGYGRRVKDDDEAATKVNGKKSGKNGTVA